MLLPMYFLIGIWGGPRREYAAIKFFLYTLFGSIFILIALLGFYFTDVQDFPHKEIVAAELASKRKTKAPDAGPPQLKDAKKGKQKHGKGGKQDSKDDKTVAKIGTK